MNESPLFTVATLIVPLVFAIVFHEVAHGRTARMLGDNTAAELGRLSLNPLRHIDPFGTVLLPLLLALAGAPVFGWAKPVPVNPRRLRNPRWGMVLVALAGPATNIALVLLAVAGLIFVAPLVSAQASGAMQFVAASLVGFVTINLFLALFNMIPVPPFDGSKVLAGFLPDGLRQRFQRLDRYALLIMIAMLLVLPRLGPQFDVIGKLVVPPVQWVLGHIANLVQPA